MKRNLTVLLLILSVTIAKSQVGINTENPQGIFHIDGQRNTSGNTNFSDDVVVDTLGRVGVGTNSPQTKVDIRAATAGAGFRLQDGTQSVDRVLTCDANGNGRWAASGIQTVLPVWNRKTDWTVSISKTNISTGTTITLPPGKWWIHASYLMKLDKSNKNSYWVRASFTDGDVPIETENCLVTSDVVQRFLISGSIGVSANFSSITGGIILDNQTNSPKTYTAIIVYIDGSAILEDVNLVHFAQGSWGEDNMIAIKIQD
ncbi:hypothetical protein [Dysgonomonas sp. 520]|uniref:hypothetical protein n=1 Tax=Dysgonomonas sp. 520 TaxID=2302931 RepID=UPI0013D0D234|nr:hypothetical protein [Dysgonomonas sp. 520]NDW09083.1 hypothetical protein [Dysgonomonas sp. 520]